MMDPFVKQFIRASLLWLCFGVVFGIAIAVSPGLIVYRPAHVHANLLGFVSMMIFGVAYHVLPRFAGRPLHNRKLASLHVWLANGGLLLMIGAWLLRPHVESAGVLLVSGGILAGTGAFTFAYNIWKTLDAAGVVTLAGAPVRAGSRT